MDWIFSHLFCFYHVCGSKYGELFFFIYCGISTQSSLQPPSRFSFQTISHPPYYYKPGACEVKILQGCPRSLPKHFYQLMPSVSSICCQTLAGVCVSRLGSGWGGPPWFSSNGCVPSSATLTAFNTCPVLPDRVSDFSSLLLGFARRGEAPAHACSRECGLQAVINKLLMSRAQPYFNLGYANLD